MAFLNPVVVEGARIALRQATATTVSAVTSTVTSSLSSTTSPPSTASASSPAAASSTDSSTLANGGGNSGAGGNSGNNNNNGGSGGNSSSLLFFVALGFGVVFTNLWIIVGVKYCFRYNARNRQMRNEDGEPINMENMPRPHRRRREKKLMPIDEVNEKFPMLKYKTWVASRAQEGLPTRGGVSAPSSRPNSIRDADGVVPELPSKERMSTDDRPTTSAPPTAPAAQEAGDNVSETPGQPAVPTSQHASKESTSSTVPPLARASTDSTRDAEATVAHKHMSQVSHDDEDDDEHIDAALPPECLGTSGDTCAICIDTLEDDDDVRGLTCGHAFHAACIDPWLTTRRACCPLCKADYYTPKPRPQPAEGAAGNGTTGVINVTLPDNSRSNNRMNMPNRPRHAFLGFGRMGRRPPSGRRRTGGEGGNSAALAPSRSRTGSDEPPSPADRPTAGGGLFSGLRTALPGFRTGRTRQSQDQPGPVASGANPDATATPTPSQLEAGTRNLPSS